MFKPIREFDGLLVFLNVGADGNPAGDAGLSTVLNNRVDIAGQILKGQMAMGVN
jgi:hypothetical protein